ncbi:hypothetical protein ACN24M_39155 [Streptomyces microflavus]
MDRRHRRQAAPGVVPVRAGPGRQPRRTQRDPRRPYPARPAGHLPAATTSADAHAVDHPGRDAALTPSQWAAAVHAHHQTAMPDVYRGGRTTDPATWLRTPENLDRLAAITRAANARRRAIEDGEIPAPAADPAGPVDRRRQECEQQHQQPSPGQGLQP